MQKSLSFTSRLFTSLAIVVVGGAGTALAGGGGGGPGGPVPVVGGKPVKLGAFPDVVAVLAPDGACSGTLIAPDLVLTAGHCTTEITPVEVIVNTVDYGKSGGEVIRVKAMYGYPDWENQFDVGVLVLEHAATEAKPRPIAKACASAAKTTVEVVGFGLTTKTGTGDNTKLNAAPLKVTDARCTGDPACNPAIAPDAEFAAGGGTSDSCFGDSGGPAFVTTPSGAPALFGVVSRGESGASNDPCAGGGVYVRADAVVSWIEKTTGRKVSRASCDKPADEPTIDDDGAEGGGCNAGGGLGSLAGAVVLLPGLVWRRKKKK